MRQKCFWSSRSWRQRKPISRLPQRQNPTHEKTGRSAKSRAAGFPPMPSHARSAGREAGTLRPRSVDHRTIDEWRKLRRAPKSASLFSSTVHGAFSFLWQDREKRMGGASPDTPERRVAVPRPWRDTPRPALQGQKNPPARRRGNPAASAHQLELRKDPSAIHV